MKPKLRKEAQEQSATEHSEGKVIPRHKVENLPLGEQPVKQVVPEVPETNTADASKHLASGLWNRKEDEFY